MSAEDSLGVASATKELHDLPIIVTGGSSGLGAAVACHLVSAGAAVTVLDRQPAADGLPSLQVDLADGRATEDAVRQVADEAGRLWGVVTCAGVDVPGESLRLVVMERVPWPRPTVLHAARRLANGGSAYDDRVVRARLAQAFGRLIRRQGDKGLFVILSSALPSRLLTAFPPEVAVSRVSLDIALERVRAKLFGEVGVEPAETVT